MAFPKSVVSVRLSMTGNTAILKEREAAPRWVGGRSTRNAQCPAPGASSPAVESSFLPGPQLVRPRRHGVGELDELAAEGGFAQEQDEGVEPPGRAHES